MNPEYGQLVQIRFNNGVFFDAIVETWSDQKSVVKLIDSNDTVIIQKTSQDVLLVKIMNQHVKPPTPTVEMQEANIYTDSAESDIDDSLCEDVDEEFEELRKQQVTPQSIQRMSELKNEINKLEREELLGNMNTFKPSGAREVSYGIPRNIQISSTAQYTQQEIASSDLDFDSELQDLFNQKY